MGKQLGLGEGNEVPSPSPPPHSSAEVGVHVPGRDPVAIFYGGIEEIEFGHGGLGESQRLAGAEHETVDANRFKQQL